MKVICRTKEGMCFEAKAYLDAQNNIMFRYRALSGECLAYGYSEMSHVWLFDDSDCLKSLTEQQIRLILNPLTDRNGQQLEIGDFICFISESDETIKRIVEVIVIPNVDIVEVLPHVGDRDNHLNQNSIRTRWTKVEPA